MTYSKFLEDKLPELADIEYFLEADCCGRVETIANIRSDSPHKYGNETIHDLPLYKITYGSKDRTKPTLILVGGVHGLERIGTQVVKALLFSFNELARWDSQTKRNLKDVRVIFIPLLNPWGMALKRRSNVNGIDLMRNAPVEASGSTLPLLSGHRLGRGLPWYRGDIGQPMETEAQALIKHVSFEIAEARAAVSVDFHSGFGFQDQLWFPYAKSIAPFPHLSNMFALKKILDTVYPYHVYKIEPQALNYVTHGDLWDYLYDQHCSLNKSTYLPLCLEMGSWNWVKKNPLQLLRVNGMFDPVLPHRRHRAFRRHHLLFDFLFRVMLNTKHWAQLSSKQKKEFFQQAIELWY